MKDEIKPKMNLDRLRELKGRQPGPPPQAKPAPLPKAKKPRKDKPRRPMMCAACKDKEIEMKGRLPHGSRFILTFDAEAGLWSGLLELADMKQTAGGILRSVTHTLRSEASGIVRCLELLDEIYRAGVKGKEAPCNPST